MLVDGSKFLAMCFLFTNNDVCSSLLTISKVLVILPQFRINLLLLDKFWIGLDKLEAML